MSTETIAWWTKGADKGVCVESISDGADGPATTTSGMLPEGSQIVTEAEFAALVRVEYIGTRNAWEVTRAQAEVRIAQAQADRQGHVDELIALGVSAEAAEAMVAPAPILGIPEQYEVPAGAAEFLRSAYRLSQESIDLILTPIEG